MDYVIRNKSGLCVKLNENGAPITCNESQRGLFETEKRLAIPLALAVGVSDTIELSDKCDMYKAWQMINEIRDLRKQRRNIKDEKLVLSGIKSQGITYLSRSSVQKCVDGLSKRKYRIRIVDEEEDL